MYHRENGNIVTEHFEFTGKSWSIWLYVALVCLIILAAAWVFFAISKKYSASQSQRFGYQFV